MAIYKDQYGQRPLEDIFDGFESYVRVSEYLEVEFKMLPPSETVAMELDMLDKTEAALREKFQEKLDQIETSRANLRALTHTVQP
ncbi:MAG: hypothetical protein ABL964_09835 [Steroidobacteraceae bacterium]